MRWYSCPQSRWTKRFRGLAPLKMGSDVIPKTSSIGLRHPSSLVEGAGKRCSERGHPFVPFLTHVASLREAGSPDSAMSINQACGRFPGQCHPGLGLICDGCIHPDAVPQDLWSMTQQAGMAQLAERPTEKPSAILTRVRVPGAARDFSLGVNFQCRFSYGVCSAPVCNRMHRHLCAR